MIANGIPTCDFCGRQAHFAFRAKPEAESVDFCNTCYESEHPEMKAIKDMAMKLAQERRMN